MRLFICVIVLACLVSPMGAVPIKAEMQVKDAAPAPKVDVHLYFESLCPSCRRFVSDQLYEATITIPSIMKLTLHPYGNAKMNNVTGNITCQHGPEECRVDTIIGCLLNFVPHVEAMPALKCMEMGILPPTTSAWWCIPRKAPLGTRTWEQVKECAAGPMGAELQRMEASYIAALNPPHKFTPWLTINGVPALEDFENVIPLICAAYTGLDKPAACAKKDAPNQIQTKADSQVCVNDKKENVTILYSKCAVVKVLGETCLYLYQDVNNSLGVLMDITERGFEVDIPLGKEEECMTDADLLLLLDLIPQLAPYKKAIKELIAVRGFIPAEIYSECVRLYNVTTGPAHGEISGCLAMDSKTMCWKEKCLHKGTKDYGCFHHNGTSLMS